MKLLRSIGLLGLGFGLMLSSCSKDEIISQGGFGPDTDITKVKFPDGFRFVTSVNHSILFSVAGPDNGPLAKTFVYIMDKPLEVGGKILYKGLTDANGQVRLNFTLPSSLEQVVVNVGAYGIPTNRILPLTSGLNTVMLGGTNPTNLAEYDVLPQSYYRIAGHARTQSNPTFNYSLGSWDSQGVPNYLAADDNLSNTFLTQVYNYLPESTPLNTTHPELLDGSATQYTRITKRSEVYVTFLHEAAGYRNTLLFYTYPKNNPPSSPSDITNLTVIFPNSSYSGSGGGLQSKDRVKIGTFGADTVVGFACASNAWNGSGISTNGRIFYDIPALNPESTPSKKQHTVLLDDISSDRFVLGFEDIQNEPITGYNFRSDYDFNDIVFLVTSNPVDGIDTTNTPKVNFQEDCDGDGVYDHSDEYRCDPTRAYNNYSNTCLAFEDLWPSLGDYDFNDLVINTNYNVVTNASNKVVEVKATYYGTGKGGIKPLGFGVDFGVPQSKITSVSGCKSPTGLTSYRSNGTENGCANAVIIPFEDVSTMFNGCNYITNTVIGGLWNRPDTVNVTVTFATNQVSLSDLGSSPFNPFIFVEGRDREIHMMDKAPTEKHNRNYFRTGSDASTPSNGSYYKTANNLPWVIALPVNFEYPHEMANIQQAYLNFLNWATSGGNSYRDWYSNTGAGYRNNARLYRR